MAAKAKVSVTIAGDLLREIDRIAGAKGRSTIFEEALSSWIRQHRRSELDRAIESYYRSLRSGDHIEDAAWAGLGDETVRRQWEP
ncbi:MAG: hypothetical protein QOD06_1839 [Candidatus Binatota bacterium]|jgi:metal-responsive CopG/Arc/MetJ family transcriptional regulator|nr:hypothetical protein [Candidatus Binatota bacterium]